MTKPRPVISLFRTPQKPAEPCSTVARVIPIRVVSRAAIEALVARLSQTLKGAA